MTFQDRVKIMFNFALYPEVTDVFIQEHITTDKRFISVEITVGDEVRCINTEVEPDASANSIILLIEPRVRLRIKEMEGLKR